MNLCIHCRHYDGREDAKNGLCTREQKTSPVDGHNYFYHADTLRSMENTDCGPAGKFFEPTNPERNHNDNPNPLVQDG